jgi:tRNA pseudouridine32 synthase/23S rRNA pseudouridine746 synthase
MFIPFENQTQSLKLPERFTFPFYYDVHPLAQKAAELLQIRLENEDFGHDFGIGRLERNGAIGKMFGVLVVQDQQGTLGYLSAFSGKLGNSNEHHGFVPPVFDLLEVNSFFRREELQINEITIRIAKLEASKELEALEIESGNLVVHWKNQLEEALANNRQSKAKRALIRASLDPFGSNYQAQCAKLDAQSMQESRKLKELKKRAQIEFDAFKMKHDKIRFEIEALRKQRALHSADLQRRIFERYTFLNINGEQKNVLDLFADLPPAGAGECAAPKLLQFAFLNHLKPICMAEFWWGMAPDSEVRIHGNFYPACKSKCEPILGHMLLGLQVDPNPITAIYPQRKLDIIYEDDWLIAINKPAEYLSVPGKHPQPNVLDDLKQKYPNLTGPVLVHRLDMSTSGILLAAKTKEMHERLQRQFVLRKVKKVYEAILDGIPKSKNGEIKLPLRVDLEDRPRQLVCTSHGSFALTTYEVLVDSGKYTRILLFPHTGRTHQLRVHCAHHLGLNCPIKGDDLYGQKADRLYLHAAKLGFYHPQTNVWTELSSTPNF